MMSKKIYSSYEEIDRELEIIDLERKLHYQKMVRSFEDLTDNITVPTLVEGFMEITKTKDNTGLLSNPILGKTVKLAAPFLIRRFIKIIFK